MKRLTLLFILIVSCGTVMAAADTTAVEVGGFTVGGIHLSITRILLILAALEALLRTLPISKNISILALIGWLNKVLPNNNK